MAALTSAMHSELNRLSDRDGVQVKTNRVGDVISKTESSGLSSVTSAAASLSTNLSKTESKVVSAH